MSWFNRNREPEHVTTNVPLSTVMRWALYDFGVNNPNEIAIELGLTPVSKEGHDKENEDSEERLRYLDEVMPFLDVISEVNGRVVTAVQLREMKEDGLTELANIGPEEIEHMVGFYQAISLSALVAAFSAGVKLDVMHITATGTGRTYEEEL